MLNKGLAWHYTAYDRRMELAKVSSDTQLSSSVDLAVHISSTIYTHDMKMPRQTGILSVGEPGASERAGSMGAAEP
jgi:hypothetical protein